MRATEGKIGGFSFTGNGLFVDNGAIAIKTDGHVTFGAYGDIYGNSNGFTMQSYGSISLDAPGQVNIGAGGIVPVIIKGSGMEVDGRVDISGSLYVNGRQIT